MLNVKVLSIEGCGDTPAAINLIQNTAEELNIEIDLSHKVLTTPAEAEKEKLIGSPTVLIEGLDIEPEMRSETRFGFT
jgi:hypothetical protein